MKKNTVLCLTAIFILNATLALAQYNNSQQDNNTEEQSGIETRRVADGVFLQVPQGSRMYRTNSLTYIAEPVDAYAARNFMDVNIRLKKLEQENKVLVDEIEYLKSKLIIQENSADENKDIPKTAEE